MSVIAAATFISFGVTSVSTYSILDRMGGSSQRRLPLLVEATKDRLDLWFVQRKSDVAAFSGSAALALQAERLAGPGAENARSAILSHLDGIRTEYPIFESFLLLDPVGELVLLSGPGPVPGREARRDLVLSSMTEPDIRYRQEERDHVVSAPLRRGAFGLSLHALVPAEALESALRPIGLPGGGSLHILDARGKEIARVGQGTTSLPRLAELRDPTGLPEGQRFAEKGHPLLLVSSSGYGPHGWRVAASRIVEWDPVVAPAPAHRLLGPKGIAMLFFTFLAVLFSGAILRPIQAFREAARLLAERDLGAPPPDANDPASREVGLLTRTFVELRGHLKRYQEELARKRREIAAANERLRTQNEQLRNANRILEKLSVTDELTGLYNQRYFREHLPIEMKRASRTRETLSLVLFDIDNFKQLNDTYGHAAGDEVLRHISGVIAEQIREMDLLARYGGEEFALLASQTPLEGAMGLAEKIRLAVRQTRIQLSEDEEPIQITISAGAATYRCEEESQLFEDADAALYQAKAFGKDQVVAG